MDLALSLPKIKPGETKKIDVRDSIKNTIHITLMLIKLNEKPNIKEKFIIQRVEKTSTKYLDSVLWQWIIQ